MARRTRSSVDEDEHMTKRLKEEVSMVSEEAIDDDEGDKEDINEADAVAAVAAVAAAVQQEKKEEEEMDESVKAADVLRASLAQHNESEAGNHVTGNNEQQLAGGHVTGGTHVSDQAQQQQQQQHEAHVQPHHGLTSINQQHQQHAAQAAAVASAASAAPSAAYDMDMSGHYNSMGGNSGQKPPVGSEQWHQMRRDNHKEVERRRRETINDGINTLAEIIVTAEKNKGQILKNAIDYIKQMKDDDEERTQKTAMEKFALMNQVSETTSQNNRLKIELQRAWREAETWKSKYMEVKGEEEKKD